MHRRHMRFAYIDSQGKEVGIPTVEALQLRIELGAIVASTMFFDASSERWAPAREHEIFRSLQRELTEKTDVGFVASPPVLGAQGASQQQPPAAADPPARGSADLPGAQGAGEPGQVPAPAPETPGASAPKTEPKPDAFEVGKFTLTPLDDLYAPLSTDVGTTPPHGDPLEGGFERTSLTFRDLGDSAFAGTDAKPIEDADILDVGPLAPRQPPAADLPLEPPLSQQHGRGPGLESRTPAHGAEGPPGWADEDAGPPAAEHPASGRERVRRTDPVPSTRSVGVGEARSAAPEAETRTQAPRREPRSRPLSTSRPPPKPARSPAVIAGAAVLVLALIGGAGWFVLSQLRGGSAAPESAYEEVEIPALSAALEGTYRSLAPGALADAMSELTARLRAAAALPPEPPPAWLAGQYLANASRYPEVAAYWLTLSEGVTGLRALEEPLFRTAFEARAASTSLSTEDRAALVERAVAGFRASLPERDRAWGQLSAVFTAALGLHDFLLEHEDEIDYEPAAAGISRDPVLEAVPATRELGDEMWQRVDDITSALEAMAALTDRVTTDRLFTLTLDRVAKTPVR